MKVSQWCLVEQSHHPFFDVCRHGVGFLAECDDCPGGWQPQSEWSVR